jgi:hypothetical protein
MQQRLALVADAIRTPATYQRMEVTQMDVDWDFKPARYVLMRIDEPARGPDAKAYSVFHESTTPFEGQPSDVSRFWPVSRDDFDVQRVDSTQWRVWVSGVGLQTMACFKLGRRR